MRKTGRRNVRRLLCVLEEAAKHRGPEGKHVKVASFHKSVPPNYRVVAALLTALVLLCSNGTTDCRNIAEAPLRGAAP